jgi:hypothetical protein
MDFEGGTSGSSRKAREEGVIGRSCVGRPSENRKRKPRIPKEAADQKENEGAQKKQRRKKKTRDEQVQVPVDDAVITAHSRSHFYGVRRIFNRKEGKFGDFFAEILKPRGLKSIKKRKIEIRRLQTDVEAGVACSVLIHIFKTYVDARRKPNETAYSPPVGGGLVLKCHSELVRRQLDKMKKKGDARLPDCTSLEEIKRFCRNCVTDFRKIAKDVKSGKRGMPEDLYLADAVKMYVDCACYSSDMYPSDRVP